MMQSARPDLAAPATHYTAKRCLLCDSGGLTRVLPLARSAIGNDYLRQRAPQEEFSLSLHQCAQCGNVQIEDVVNPDLLFRQYTYATNSSLGLVDHFRKSAAEIAGRYGGSPDLVVDIGSNDGSLLSAFRELGSRVIGIDPAAEIAQRATADGIPTIPEYFTPSVASRIREEHGPAGLITANNVFAHSDQLPAMADAVRELLAADGLFTFEVSYLLDIVQKMLFDTIYHEHLCYHSVKSLEAFFARHGLQLINVTRIPTKGGSLRGTVQLAGGARPLSPDVRRLIEWEELARLHSPGAFQILARRMDLAREQFAGLLDQCRAAGKIVSGYGASPTVTTLMAQFDLARRIDFLVDDNPVKQSTFSPGSHVPVYPSNALYERDVDVVAILAWNYAAPIMAKHQRFAEAGGRFAIPLPQLVLA